MRKQWLEDLVVNETMKLVEDDASMNAIIAKVMELQDQESTDLPIYEKQLKETEVGITNMLNAIQMGILTSSTKERLEALEDQRKELQARIAEERLAKPKMKEEFVRFWLLRFRKLDMTQPEQRQALVDTFINAIYLYDDKVLITFNYKEGTETVAFGEAVKAEKSSDMSARGTPDIERQIERFDVLFCYVTPKNRGWYGQYTVFARSAFSWESSAWAGITLKCVVDAGDALLQPSPQLLPQCIQCDSSIRIHAIVQAAGGVPEGRTFSLRSGKRCWGLPSALGRPKS